MVLQPLYMKPQWNFTTYAGLVSHRHVLHTIKGGGEKSRLVPELGQMFEINGNFLVFIELGQKKEKKEKELSFFIGWAWGVLQLPLLVLLRLFPLTEQKQTLFSIVVFSYSCWEGVGGLSVGILLLWNMVGKDAWAKYLYKHGQ